VSASTVGVCFAVGDVAHNVIRIAVGDHDGRDEVALADDGSRRRLRDRCDRPAAKCEDLPRSDRREPLLVHRRTAARDRMRSPHA
jgi:hypothetical protein